MDCPKEELKWLNIHESPGLQIYNSSSVSQAKEGEVYKLIQSSFQQQLPKDEQDMVINAINEDPNLLSLCPKTPDRISDLVDNNPEIASAIIIQLFRLNSYGEYLDALMKTEVSFKSMQVMTTLLSQIEIPSDYIDTFTSHCIASCTNVDDKGKQTRLVRLVSVFLQNLITSNHFKNEVFYYFII